MAALMFSCHFCKRNFCHGSLLRAVKYRYPLRRYLRYNRIINATATEEAPSDLSYPNERAKEVGLDGDFFGIESDVGVKHVGQHALPAIEKYAALVRKRDAQENDEKFVEANYGTVRYDIDNIPKYHGMYENKRLASTFKDLAKSGVKFVGNTPLESSSTTEEFPAQRSRPSSIDRRDNKRVTNTDLYGVNRYDGGQGSLKRHAEFLEGNVNFIDNQYFSETGNLNNSDGTTVNTINEQVGLHPDASMMSTFQTEDFEDAAMKNGYLYIPNVSTEVEDDSSFSVPVIQNSVKLNPKNNCHPQEVMIPDNVCDEQYFYSHQTKEDPFEITYVKCQSTNTKHVKEQQQDRVASSVMENDKSADCNQEDTLDPFGVMFVGEKHEGKTFLPRSKTKEIFDVDNDFKFEKLGKLYSNDDTGDGSCHNQASSKNGISTATKNNRAAKFERNGNRHLISSYRPTIKEKAENPLLIKNAQQENSRNALEVKINEYDEFDVRSKGNLTEEFQPQNTGTHGQPASESDGDPKTALDFVKQLRKEDKSSSTTYTGENLDSKGFRILKNQVPNLDHMTRDEVLQILKKSIIYNDNDIVAIDKPYGIICHGHVPGNNKKALTSYLVDLAHFTDKSNPHPKLYMVHRLDKETTGVMLFAKTQQMASILNTLLANRKIQKIYWAITKGVPSPLEGIINIPIAEDRPSATGKFKMILRPDITEELKGINKTASSSKAHEAITYYKVLGFKDNAALVHIRPETGLKHQIRAHLGLGLRCPVLGDHKYSNIGKLAPQKLFDDMLTKLQVRQSKVRYIPMHLHSHCVIIPEILDGKNLFIESKLPVHFAKNLKSLKIQKQ